LFKEEGTPRPRSGGASTSSGYNSQEDITRNWRDALPDFSSRQEDQAIGAFMLLPTLEAGVRELTGQGLSGDDAIKKMADAVRVAVCHLIRL